MDHIGLARRSLDGLSVGDAFGERFFVSPAMVDGLIAERAMPPSPWRYTDDTEMALSIFAELAEHGGIDRDRLALRYGRRYDADPRRGYGGTAHEILRAIADGRPWREISAAVFDGQGSMGNGAAMRSAPIGGFAKDDLERVVELARASAEPTHMHPDGVAGAIAVAVAAAVAARGGDGRALFGEVLARTPGGPTRDALRIAETVDFTTPPPEVAARLGSGARVISMDTVPFSLWCAARHLDDFEAAMWTTVSGLGDRDTTCAIVGGIVALSAGVPPEWIAEREPLPL